MSRREELQDAMDDGSPFTEGEVDAAVEAAQAGGFSLRSTGPAAGRPARNVFATGFAPDAGRAGAQQLTGSSPVTEQIADFAMRNRDLLTRRGASMAMGGWQDPATGAGELDVSVLTPRTAEGLTAAAHIASESQQAAIGELGPSASDPYIGDVALPEDLQRGSGVWAEPAVGDDPTVTMGTAATLPVGRAVITPSRKDATEVWARDLAKEKALKDSGLPEATVEERVIHAQKRPRYALSTEESISAAADYVRKNKPPLP